MQRLILTPTVEPYTASHPIPRRPVPPHPATHARMHVPQVGVSLPLPGSADTATEEKRVEILTPPDIANPGALGRPVIVSAPAKVALGG